MSILSVKNINKRFDETYSLDAISFDLPRSDILCFLGPSGCGKTTLLRIIAGLERADSGAVHFAGYNITNDAPHKRGFGMMFQEYALFPHLSVTQNIAFGLRMQNQPESKQKERVEEMLELVGLAGRGNRSVSELSGGERQRVALARSLAPQPKLLMLDEPLAALDRGLRERLASDLRRILKAVGVTAIFVTHDQSEAFAIADSIAVFDDGKLLQMDSPENVYAKPASVAVAKFLGFRNILPAQANSDGWKTTVGTFSIEKDAEGGTKTQRAGHQDMLLIRPEGARLANGETAKGYQRISGTVRERTFLGHGYQMRIETHDTLLRFLLPTIPLPPQIGEKADIDVPQSSFILLS